MDGYFWVLAVLTLLIALSGCRWKAEVVGKRSDYYRRPGRCLNCKHQCNVLIPKGREWRSGATCPYCGVEQVQLEPVPTVPLKRYTTVGG